ncbi:MAG: hypothetical protein P8L85_11430 [Rubripirellula sp.]|nr:hypothetical protein [Rubripirellula sp.]
MTVEPDGIRVYRMRITDVLKGDPTLKDSSVEVTSSRELSSDEVFWLVGFGDDRLQWFPPTVISTESISYLRGLSGLPESGPKRLEYFLRFLQHTEDFIAADAYNEFAEASLKDIKGLGDKLARGWVIAQLRDTSVPLHRRRLCWTLLSQCGTATDAGLFDDSLSERRADPTFQPGMDAAIACFISLGGEQALARIERDFLANAAAADSDCFSAVSAIRVHGTELDVIPRERLAKALRNLLARPELADLVIPDLARWGDWSAIDRMVELFQISTEETALLKPAAVRYLKTCPLPDATAALDRLREIDGNAVQVAEASMLFNFGRASLPVPPPDPDDPTFGTTNSDAPDVEGKP